MRALDAGIAHAWSAFRTHVAGHESYRPAVDEASYRLLDLDMPADERDDIADPRNDALARLRHAALRTLLGGTLDSLSNTVAGAAADALKEGMAAILKDDRLPAEFPDSESETCRGGGGALPHRHRRAGREGARAERGLAALHGGPHGRQPGGAARSRSSRARAPALSRTGGGGAQRDRRLSGRPGGALRLAGPPRPGGRTAARERGAAAGGRAPHGDRRRAGSGAGGRGAYSRAHRGARGSAKENDALRPEKHRLGGRLAALQGAPAESAEDPAVPPLTVYADLPDWTERHLPGRVVLAGRALKSLKSARLEDVGLVGKAVALLGTTYHRMKTEGGTELREAFEQELRELKLQETPSINPDRQGKARDSFEIEWEGKRLMLDAGAPPQEQFRDAWS